MKLKRRSFLIGGMAILATTLIIPLQASAAKRIVFGGGPAGGTFQVVANAIQVGGGRKDRAIGQLVDIAQTVGQGAPQGLRRTILVAA